jgi:hypothetical protein
MMTSRGPRVSGPTRLVAALLYAECAVTSPGELTLRQEFVVEPDEAVQIRGHEDTGETCDPLGGSPAHEVIRAGGRGWGGPLRVGGRAGHDDDHAPLLARC